MNNREAFETWANTHGGLDLTTHEAMDNEKLPFPCTYYNYTTEIAWRAFANKKVPALAQANVNEQSQAQQPTAYRVIATVNGEVVRDSLEFTRMSEIDEKVVRKSYDLEIFPLYAAMQSQAQQPYDHDLGSVLMALENAISELKGIIHNDNLKPYIAAKDKLIAYISTPESKEYWCGTCEQNVDKGCGDSACQWRYKLPPAPMNEVNKPEGDKK